MDWIKSSTLIDWYSNTLGRYNSLVKKHKNYRCKIVDMVSDGETEEITLWVMISGVKNQIVPYFPNELVIDDLMLGEFSPFDARAITFYAIMQKRYKNQYIPTYLITGQVFLNGKTIFIIKELKSDGEIRKYAYELYCDMAFLGQFGLADLVNIVSTAIQEQTMDDLQKIGY